MRKFSTFILLAGLWLVLSAQAPPPVTGIFVAAPDATGTNPIAASRLPLNTATLPNPAWSTAGATITHRTTQCVTAACNTLSGGTVSTTTINNALASAPENTYVAIPSGTHTITGGVRFDNINNVTLRGAGSSSTVLNVTGDDPCGGGNSLVCVYGDAYIDEFYNEVAENANVTAACITPPCTDGVYQAGATTLVMTAKTNLQVGSQALLAQNRDIGADTWPEVFVCHQQTTVNCADAAGGTSIDWQVREQRQFMTVTSIEGGSCAPTCDVGITPGLLMDNWRTAKDPEAWWDTGIPATGLGVEDLTIRGVNHSSNGINGLQFIGVTNSWAARIVIDRPPKLAVITWSADHITIRDSYMFGWARIPDEAAESEYFHILTHYATGILIENNIFQAISSAVVCQDGATNVVIGYNYTFDNNKDFATIPSGYEFTSFWGHNVGCQQHLYEGNDSFGAILDQQHGVTSMITYYRNSFAGWEDDDNATARRTPILMESFNRFVNIVSNVLGTSGFHTNYSESPGDADGEGIYSYGLGNTGDNDSRSGESLLRWCNWDVVTSSADNSNGDQTGTKKDTGEVPSGISGKYANTVPSTDCGTMPDSLYLSAKPSFFGSITAWPVIGPDVSGGNVTNKGGHVYKIPARVCAETMSMTMGQTTPSTFNASSCYPVP